MISVSNIGASAIKDVGLNIAGFSADVPLFLSILSACLQMNVRQEIIATGHIASLAGDIVPVLGIPAKIDAAIASGDIAEVLLPDIEKDLSATLLMPRDDLSEATTPLYMQKWQIKLTFVKDIHDVMKSSFTGEALTMSSLAQGFFDASAEITGEDNPLSRCVMFLLDSNTQRFWETTRDLLFDHNAEKAKYVIKSFIDYYLARKRYPQNFGTQLYRLAMSLPILVRKTDGMFPLLSIEQCIALSQHATQMDHADVQVLFRLTSSEDFFKASYASNLDPQDQPSSANQQEELMGKILIELSDGNLSRRIGLPLDEARASYPMNTVVVKDAAEFNQVITGFFVHMIRYTNPPEGDVSWEAAASESIDRVENSFRHVGGYTAALAEAKTGAKGGLRYVFDVMTENEKSVKIGKYVTMILKEAIDSLDWEAKVKLSAHIKNRYGRYLSDLLRIMEPEQLAHHLEESIRLLAEGGKGLDRWLRTH